MVNASALTRPLAGEPPMRESTTREQVLRDISVLGPITTSELVTRLQLTETAVRRHVDGLHAEGLIEAHQLAAGARRRGRPAKAWVVSARGHASLTSDYSDLAGSAMRFLAETAGRSAVADFARRRALELVADANLDPSAPVADRTQALVRALNADGYAATARPVGEGEHPSPLTGIQLCQGHCPVQQIATEFPEFCDAEAEVFSEVLGVHVQRLATLAHGDHVCTTFIPLTAVTTPKERSS